MAVRPPTADDVVAEIRRSLALLCTSGEVIELRVPNAGRAGSVSGYYTDPAVLLRDALRLNTRSDLLGIYVTVNAEGAAA